MSEPRDAHATARARDARATPSEVTAKARAFWAEIAAAVKPLTTHYTYDPARDQVIDNLTGEITRLTQETPMPSITRTITVRLDPELVALLTEIRDRLPEPDCVAPFDPDVIAANLAAIKHETETPMREHGECCEPAPADVDPDEALAKVLHDADLNGHFSWKGTGLETRADYLRMARAAREHIESEWEPYILREQTAREKAQDRAVKAEAERDEAQMERSDALIERDALRKRLDALRADLSPGGLTWTVRTALRRDDERAAKVERR